MQERMSKSQLLEKIRTRQGELEELLAPLSEAQMTTPGVNGAWSMKDTVAHLTAWQKVALDRLRAAASGGEPQTPKIFDVNDMNERYYQENKARSLSDVMADFRRTHQGVVESVEVLSDDDLNKPDRYSWWWEGEPLWPNIVGNTYGHIDEHIDVIQRWLDINK
jgi:hypothetical protein